jgi:hypothetical protein
VHLFPPRVFSSRSALTRKALPVTLGLAVILAGTLAYAGFSFVGKASQTHAYPTDAKSVPTYTGKAVSGQLIHAALTSTAPALTASQQAKLRANQDREESLKTAPVGPLAHATAQTERHPGPQVPAPTQNSRSAAAAPQINDTDFVVEQSSATVGEGTNGPCHANGLCSHVMEPSIANDGKNVMMSGNWFDAVSHNAGAAWSYLDPFTAFTPGNESFCCDQQIIYEPSRDRVFWESLWLGITGSDPNSLLIADSAGTDLSSWCSYNFTPDKFGLPTTDLLDYPNIAYSSDYFYLTFNAYDHLGNWINTTVARMPLSTMANGCAAVTPTYITTNQNFSVILVTGVQGTMYFASNWYTQTAGTGSSLHIWAWGDGASAQPAQMDRTIDPWNFINAGSANCASSDNVVINWCARLDSRGGTGYMTKANYRGFGPSSLGFAWSAGANPSAGIPYPYTVRVYFNLTGFTYQGHDNLYSQNFAIVYPSMAANYRGFVGGTFSYGGGNSTTHYYPGSAVFIDDPVNPTAPWAINYWLPGQANTDSNPSDSEYQSWGDFNTARAFSPNGYDWIAGGWYVASNGVPQAGEIIWGRGRDHNAFLRWSQV